MSPEKQRELSRRGGKSVPKESRSFYSNRELAKAAGCKGGKNVEPQNRAFSVDRSLAASAGRKAKKGK